MARSRNIKPGFFVNDQLGELSPLTRLLFAGLWTLADRAGRLEDRPRKIRAEVLPYDDCDADVMLADLQQSGFISRYEVAGVRVIQVVAWCKHQNPHVKEAASTLPTPYPNQTSTVQEQCEGERIPERAGLIPSLLIPDSLLPIPDSTEEIPAGILSPAKLPDCPHDLLIDMFEKHLSQLPQPRRSLWRASKNATALKERWRWVMTATHEKGEQKGHRLATTKDEAVAWFERYFAHVEASDFLTGRNGKFSACDLGWLMKADNFAKVLQGNYDNKVTA